MPRLHSSCPESDFWQWKNNFFFSEDVQTSSTTHPNSHSMSTVGSDTSSEVAGAWSWSLISIEGQGDEWVELYLSSPYMPSWHAQGLSYPLPMTHQLINISRLPTFLQPLKPSAHPLGTFRNCTYLLTVLSPAMQFL